MAKKKHPKLPNGFGSIKYLGKNRSNPYAVYPPTTEFSPNGSPKTPKAICYAPDWYTGFYALLAWKNGKYTDDLIVNARIEQSAGEYDVVKKILAIHNTNTRIAREQKTFADVYNNFYAYKYERDKTKEYSESTKYATKAAYKNCSVLHAKPFLSITTEDMQKVIDDCEKSHATKEHIVNLFKQIYDYADSQDLCDKKYSDYVKINTPDDDEKGVPFTESEIDTIWEHKDDAEIYKFILIMIYTGMRIAEYKNVKINTEKKCFIGGVKTDASKNRIVPLSPLILGFVSAKSEFYTTRTNTLRIWITSALNDIGIKNHTPHDCRHTFSWLCDKYGVDSLSKKMILGHTLGDSVTDTVYGHRTFEELYTEVCKIKHW